jgi:hypothetical protein
MLPGQKLLFDEKTLEMAAPTRRSLINIYIKAGKTGKLTNTMARNPTLGNLPSLQFRTSSQLLPDAVTHATSRSSHVVPR